MKYVFLTVSHSQKSSKGTNRKKVWFLCPIGARGAILVPGRLGEAFMGSLWHLSSWSSPNNFLLKDWKSQVPITYLVKENAIGGRSTNFFPSHKLESGYFNCAQWFLNTLLQQSGTHTWVPSDLKDEMSALFQALIPPFIPSTLRKTWLSASSGSSLVQEQNCHSLRSRTKDSAHTDMLANHSAKLHITRRIQREGWESEAFLEVKCSRACLIYWCMDHQVSPLRHLLV